MEIVHIGKGTDMLTSLPPAPSFLSTVQKKYYKAFGKILIAKEILKESHLVTLQMLATNYEMWAFAVKEINKKNKEAPGTGYIQVYQSKATNITTELVLKRNAEKAMIENITSFGMDPQSEKKLKGSVENGQLDMFEDFEKFTKSKMTN